MKKLVFLHIEKCAGTSLRLAFDLELGRNNVFWYGRDSNSERFDQKGVEDFKLLGGHREYSFYAAPDFGYMSIVRDPMQRVISLYNYLRTVDLANWIPRGLDSKSLNGTIQNSEQFVELIRGGQCRYLSGISDFERTMEHIHGKKYFIGSMDEIGYFLSHLAKKLKWRNPHLVNKNASLSEKQYRVAVGWRLKRKLRDLLVEDIKLYRYIADECNGLLESVGDESWESYRLLLQKHECMPRLMLALETIDFSDNAISARVLLRNSSQKVFPRHPEVFVGMRALGAGGGVLKDCRSRVELSLVDGQSGAFSLYLHDVPREMIKAVEFGIFDMTDDRWLGATEVSAATLLGV
jgi:hypothetical protein